MDPINRRILDELQRDGRVSLAELARRLQVSPPTVAERLSRLESAGVIRGYHAEVDPLAAGYPLSVIIRVRPAPRQLHKIVELAPRLPEVVECHRITGDDCFLIKAHVRDVLHLEAADRPAGDLRRDDDLDHPVLPRAAAARRQRARLASTW